MKTEMSLATARSIAGTLGFPTKMPGTAYALPASKCIIGSKLVNVPNSVCFGCYAFIGMYSMGNAVKAMRRRLAGLSSPDWVAAMTRLLLQKHATAEFKMDLGLRATRRGLQRWRMNVSGWHRWHDSGDLQGIWHLAKICDVAAATPKIKHWLATRETKMVLDYVQGGGLIPSNLTIRVSATMVDGAAPRGWGLTSTVHENVAPSGHVCPAPTQGHECRSCRACWSKDVANVSYEKH